MINTKPSWLIMKDSLFWSGAGWATGYPHALLFSEAISTADARTIAAGATHVVSNYGDASELRIDVKPINDVSVVRDGDSIIIFTINTDAAAEWVEENVHLESWQKQGYRSFVVDFRFAWDLAQGMQAAGFTVGDG